MGNNNVYSEGHFLTPNKIDKPKVIDKDKLNIENVFGKIDMPTSRAQKGQQTFVQEIQNSFVTKIQYYEKEVFVQKIVIRQRGQCDVLSEKKNESQVPQIENLQQRKVKTEVQNSKITKSKETIDFEKYTTRKDSPVKHENFSREDSKVRIFESRLQNKYFKLNK